MPERMELHSAEATPTFGTCQDQMEACKPGWPHPGRSFIQYEDGLD